MKIATICSILCVSAIFAKNVHSQTARVNIQAYNAEAKNIITQIEEQTNYLFVYNNESVNLSRKVSIQADNSPVAEVLSDLFKNSDIVYAMEGNNILLMKRTMTEQQTGKTIKGQVTDQNGEAVIGANIVEKGTSNGTITDLDGNFTLHVPENSQLVVTYIGFLSKEIKVTAQTSYQIQLVEDTQALEEVVVVGYSTQKKKDLTGAVSVVDMADLPTSPSGNIMQSLQGRLPGVKISTDGTPGASGLSVRIRGYGSLGNNDPLYIIDGLPTNNPSDIMSIAQSEIESIQVLKDASSASIYGSRAANGVIIVTTKKGKEKIKVSLESQVGYQTMANTIEMLNAKEWGDMYWQALKNDGKTLSHPQYGTGPTPVIPQYLDNNPNVPSADTNWMKEVFNNAVTQSHTLTISNGSEKGHSLISLNYLDQEGMMITTYYNKIGARINTDYNLFKWLTVGENFSFSKSKTNMYDSSGAYQSSSAMFSEALAQQPLLPVYNADGTYAGPMTGMGDARNPVARLNQTKDNYSNDYRGFGNLYANIQFMKELSFKSNLSVDFRYRENNRFEPKWSEGSRANALNVLTLADNKYEYWSWSNVLNYKKVFNDKHDLDLLVGTEASRFSNNWKSTSRQSFASESKDYLYLDAGEGTQSNSGSASVYSLLSFFGKVNYSFDNKYLLSATLRRDASSKLGAKNNSGVFPAFSVGWRISQEEFMKNVMFLSDMKIRFGWGQTGNQEIANYATFNIWGASPEYASYDMQGANTSAQSGYIVKQMGNPNLKWETTTQSNIGLDLSVLDNKLYLTADYFYKKSTDMLIRPDVSAVVGEGAFPYINGAEMVNKGFEFIIGYRGQSNEFTYNIDVNFDMVRNEVTKVNGVEYFESNSMCRTLVGYPISSFYGYVADGLFQSQAEVEQHATQSGARPGLIRFKDVNKDGVINASDRTFIGNPHPDFSYGINLGAGYKGFDLNVFFSGMQGNDIYTRNVRNRLDFFSTSYGHSKRTLDAWTPENTNTKIPALSTSNTGDVQRHSSYFVEDGSFLKLKDITLGYTLGKIQNKNFGIDKLRFYFKVQNVFTITKYEGMDPEVISYSNPLSMGLDNTLYPTPRTFTFGINVDF